MIQANRHIQGILARALESKAPTREECVALLELPATRIDASLLRATADAVMRERFGGEAIILGQIGIEIAACPAKCKFCSFGEGHTQLKPSTMKRDEIMAAADALCGSGDLYALFLMTMHTFDFQCLLETVRASRARIPKTTQIVVNIGDFDAVQAAELKSAGVNGAYHVCRLGEGTDTELKPEDRKKTIRAIKESGMDWYYCCEPIGPEHTPRQIVDQIFLGIEFGCFQHAAMRRVHVPNAPLAKYGQITELRLGQVVAVVALAMLGCPVTGNIAVHEPNLIGLTSGANVVYAETGANPRDTQAETTGHRGRDITDCKRMLHEAGFDKLAVAPRVHRPLENACLS